MIWMVMVGSACAGAVQAGDVTAQQVVDRIRKEVKVEWSRNTVDTFKAGDPATKVTGIATTHLATLDVLKAAHAKGCNFVITHEPTFYTHRDDTRAIEGDAVLAAKRAYIREHGLVVWRFHDHIHRRDPDGILEGMIDALGWREHRRKDVPNLFTLPKATIREIAARLKKTFDGTTSIRVIGSPDLEVTKVALAPGAPGSKKHIDLLQRDDVELLVGGEAREWESVVYAQDAVSAGKRKAFIILGHANSEEAGMKHVAEWLRGFVKEAPVKYVPGGDPFWEP